MLGKRKVLCVTLARGGSKRVPKKNIALINKKPLLWYTFKEAAKSKYIDKYVVSTECQETMNVCEKYGVEVFKRPQDLARDNTTSAAALINVAEKYKDYDIVVELMATNPLKEVQDIDAVLEKLDKTKADSVVSVVRIWDHHPSRVKSIKDDRMVDFFPEIPESRRQDLRPEAYVRNGSIYATTMKSLIKNKVRLGPDTRPHIMPQSRTVNIDEPIDLELARLLIEQRELQR